ncbi:SusC/RagA family TonB-linked outer membrane protein [Chitinophaga filiformis]|uniref:SusC/RagA family TonB-linked outer membrane protein n=1 Tax=Chitinophaga filiformis TaxID=104663 RepID=A0ABY4I6T7_CHIFI|nr:SusC/RagA family TonB-linked outer membrane protein [Chitinophaga filiformis]UPK71794.1 SusC/RagA family TonB-linked outer membrane protein [Chitinophaga filiformis]
MPRTVHVKRNFLYAFCAGFLCLCVIFRPVAKASTEPLQGKEISISVRKSSLSNILNQVSKKSGITIYFVDTDLAPYTNIDYDAKDKDVTSILTELFKGKDLLYEVISEKQIGVRKAKEKTLVTDEYRDTLVTVTGQVTDERGMPIIGATVLVKGTRNGVTTSQNGSFKIEAKTNNSLSISSVGYLSVELPVSKRGLFGVVKLKEFVSTLDETIIVAYGETTRRKTTSNIGTVKAKDIETQPVNNPLLVLQGRVPGLFVNQNSGIPGGGVTVRIQGLNSMVRGNDPLYVIDGVPYFSQLLDNGGNNAVLGASGGTVNGNPLSYINPSDIESIDVLKDADATAIYGSRAANGAILITTKKGKSGETKFDLNLQSGIGKMTKRLNLLNTAQYIKMRKEAKANDNAPIRPTDYDINGLWDTTRNTDWQDKLLGGTAQYTNLQFSVSGGGELTNFLIGMGYQRETSVFPTDLSNQKGSVHFNIGNRSKNNRFKTQLTGTYVVFDNKLTSNDLTYSAITLPPNAPLPYKDDGTINWTPNSSGNSTFSTLNPAVAYLRTYRNNTRNLIANSNIGYRITENLELQSNFGFTSLSSDEINKSPLSSVPPERVANTQSSSRYTTNEISTWIIEPQLLYRTEFKRNHIDALLGATVQQQNSNGLRLSGRGYSTDEVLDDIRSANTVQVDGTTKIMYRYSAIFFRVNYTYEDKYVVNVAGRRDGSSRFGKENLYHNFGSIGVGWIFSEESSVKDIMNWLSFGKIRASYGTTGSDQIGDYTFLNLYSPNTSYSMPYQGGNALQINGQYNPYLQWEETKKLQVGVDLGFFNDRVTVSANYVSNRSSNQLLYYSLPWTTGYPTVPTNLPATVKNRGIEASITSNNLKGKLKWSTNFNISLQRNRLASFPNISETPYSDMFVIGESIAIEKAYKLNGVNRENGVFEFLDREGKKTSDPTDEDRFVIINPLPKIFGGLSNTFEYKGIEVSFLFQFVKQKGIGNKFGIYPGSRNTNQPTSVLDRWQQEGDVAVIQKFNSNSDLSSQQDKALTSDVAWEDASYVRLKNLSVSYNIPIKRIGNMEINNLRIFVHGQNLLTFTKYSGLDPETRSSSILPPLTVLTFGLNMKF